MSSSPPAHNTRLATKRKRLANQEDAPPPKTRKTRLNRMLSETATSTVETTERTKRRRMMQRYAPEDNLDPDEVGSSGTNPPLRYYGWPFKYDQVLEFAQRHHIHFPVMQASRHLFGGKEEMDFADLSDEHYSNPRLLIKLKHVALLIVVDLLARTTGVRLEHGWTYSLDWDGVIYVWSNYNVENRFRIVQLFSSWERAEKTLNKVMREMSGERLRPQWWWSKQTHLGEK